MNANISRILFEWWLVVLMGVVGCTMSDIKAEKSTITGAQARKALLEMLMVSEEIPREFEQDLQETGEFIDSGVVWYGRWQCHLNRRRWMVYEQRDYEDGRGYRNEWGGAFVVDGNDVVRAEIDSMTNLDW